jgi:hypothetical protein
MINIDQLCSTLPLQNPAKSTKVVHRTSLYLALGQQMSRHLLINLSQKLEERIAPNVMTILIFSARLKPQVIFCHLKKIYIKTNIKKISTQLK